MEESVGNVMKEPETVWLIGNLRRQGWELRGRGTWVYLKGWDRKVLAATSPQ